MPTIREVSRRAKVSASTVSRVLNGTAPVAEETKKRVLDAVKELSYRPNAFARSLATNRSGGIGVSVNDLGSPYYGAMLKGIEAEVEAAGMHMLVSSGHADRLKERRSVEFLLERRPDALIVHLEATPDLELLDLMHGAVPVVLIGRHLADVSERCVFLDNETGGERATSHLIDNGHQRIAHIAGPLSFPDSRDRLQGYRRALEKSGIEYDERLVVEADFLEEGGYQAVDRLLARETPFSALFSANDQMAAGALQALREAGKAVPDDVSVMGYDDVILARYLSPGLTTIRQPLAEMGRAAARIALDVLAGNETEVNRKFEPQLVERESVSRIAEPASA
ncbi:MAG TPA: LacI family DNA-binding transcriptional regulator [Trueperaceae bacterium]